METKNPISGPNSLNSPELIAPVIDIKDHIILDAAQIAHVDFQAWELFLKGERKVLRERELPDGVASLRAYRKGLGDGEY